MGRIPALLVEVMKSVIKGLREQKILINCSPWGFQILKVICAIDIKVTETEL